MPSSWQMVRVLAGAVARGESYGPKALSVNESGKRIAFIGPLDSTVTLLDTTSQDEV